MSKHIATGNLFSHAVVVYKLSLLGATSPRALAYKSATTLLEV